MPNGTNPHLLDPDHLPTPFSADEIRDGCPPGRRMVVQTRSPSETAGRLIVFTRHDDSGAFRNVTPLDEAGRPSAPASEEYSTWLDFQRHALFPRKTSTVEHVEIDHPLGRLSCLVYTVTDVDSVSRFWFATSFPGMPVRVTTERAGTQVQEMIMLENGDVNGG